MTLFDVHTPDTAPDGAAEILVASKKAYGFVPNLHGVLAESPSMLKAYKTIGGIFDESSFSATERQLIILATSRYNECDYCMAAHTIVAGMQKVPAEVVEAIRGDRPIADARLEALRTFTTAVIEKRAWLAEEDIAAFLEAGYSKAQILEVILGISFKTLSNYTNHLANTPLDEAFESGAWSAAIQSKPRNTTVRAA
jgi:uncharacterized peroxidase-related enzyme